MDIVKDWEEIRKHFNKSFSSNFYVSVASVNADNSPIITPIGSLFLNRDQTGFYFEKYPTKIPKHSQINKKVCVLAVNSNRFFWLKALFRGKFKGYPAVRLYGELGERREARSNEIRRLKKRMKLTNGTKGNSYLWGDMAIVRELKFERAEMIHLGNMTHGL